MGVITDSYCVDFIVGFLTLFSILYVYLKSKNNYWKHLGIPYVKPSLLFGNISEAVFGKKNIADIYRGIYKQLEGHEFGGFFELPSPSLMIRDPKLIEKILIKDFQHFVDRGFVDPDPENEPITANLINLTGSQWRFMRHKLTPTFTTGKLKGMFEQICNCGEDLLANLEEYSISGEAMDAKTVLSFFTIDVIASCAFGLQFKHDSKEGKEFRQMVDRVSKPPKIEMIRSLFHFVFKRIGRLLKISRFDPVAASYFLNVVKSTVDFRKQNKIQRNDFLQLLMEIQEQEAAGRTVEDKEDLIEEDAHLREGNYKLTNNDESHLEFTDGVLAAQAFVFLAAGSETTSSSTSYILYALATNPEVQRRAQEEVDAVLAKSGDWSFQNVKDMSYLDQVIQEGLRRYPFVPALSRVVTTPYQLPGTNITLPRGQRITIPVYPIHMDPTYYPDPERFDPDRFKDNNNRSSFKYMPFGDGPRMCIGMRFALLEMKVCLARILSKYSVSLSDKTPFKLEYDTSNAFISKPKGGIWLLFTSRES